MMSIWTAISMPLPIRPPPHCPIIECYHCSLHDRCILEWILFINLSLGRLCPSQSPYILPTNPMHSKPFMITTLMLFCCSYSVWCAILEADIAEAQLIEYANNLMIWFCAQTKTSEMTIMCLLWCWPVLSLSALFCFVFVVGAHLRCDLLFLISVT